MAMNLALAFTNRWVDGLACGVWSTTVLSVYVFVLLGEDGAGIEGVGIAQACQGLLAVSCGLLARRLMAWSIRKDIILRVLALAQCSAIAMTCIVMMNDDWDSYRKFFLLCAGLALWGIGQANSLVVDALFANSVPAASGSVMYSRLHLGYLVSQVLGPATAGVMFLYTSNTWGIIPMQQVVLAGMIIACIPAATLLFFNDDWALRADRPAGAWAPARRQGRATISRSRDEQAGRGRKGAGEEPLARALLAGDLEDGGVGASNLSQAGGWCTEDEQNLEGFENATFRSPPGSGPCSQETSPARPVVVALSAAQGSVDSPTSDAAPASSPEQQPLVAPGPEQLLGSHALDIGDSLSDSLSTYSSMSSLASAKPRRAASMDKGLAMSSLDEDRVLSFEEQSLGVPMPLHGGQGASTARSNVQCSSGSAPGSGSVSPISPAEGGTGPEQLQEASFSVLLPPRMLCPVHGGKREEEAGGAPDDVRAASCTCWQSSAERVSSKRLLVAKDSFSLKPIAESLTDGALAPTPSIGRMNTLWGETQQDVVGSSGQQQQQQEEARGTAQQEGIGGPSGQQQEQQQRDNKNMTQQHASASPFTKAAAGAAAAAAGGGAEPGSSSKPQPHLAAGGLVSRRMARRLSREESWRPNASGPCCSYDKSWIPGVLAITDLIMGFASGMVIKFFPIFFMSKANVTPSTLCFFYCLLPLALSAFGYLTQAGAQLVGRGPMILLNRLTGIILLFVIALKPDVWLKPQLMGPICIVRAAVMNCNYAVEKSILLDAMSEGLGDRWGGLEMFTSFGWSGAALLGGWIISNYGFQSAFVATGLLQTLGWLVSLLLLPLIPRSELSVDEVAIILTKLKTLQKMEARVSR